MDKSARLLTVFLALYKSTPNPTRSWKDFWKTFMSNSPKPYPGLIDFVAFHTQTLSTSLNSLGQDHPLVRKFVSSLPLRLSKTILSWPTTPEMLKELMTD